MKQNERKYFSEKKGSKWTVSGKKMIIATICLMLLQSVVALGNTNQEAGNCLNKAGQDFSNCKRRCDLMTIYQPLRNSCKQGCKNDYNQETKRCYSLITAGMLPGGLVGNTAVGSQASAASSAGPLVLAVIGTELFRQYAVPKISEWLSNLGSRRRSTGDSLIVSSPSTTANQKILSSFTPSLSGLSLSGVRPVVQELSLSTVSSGSSSLSGLSLSGVRPVVQELSLSGGSSSGSLILEGVRPGNQVLLLGGGSSSGSLLMSLSSPASTLSLNSPFTGISASYLSNSISVGNQKRGNLDWRGWCRMMRNRLNSKIDELRGLKGTNSPYKRTLGKEIEEIRSQIAGC